MTQTLIDMLTVLKALAPVIAVAALICLGAWVASLGFEDEA